jgi:hypothetical protein
MILADKRSAKCIGRAMQNVRQIKETKEVVVPLEQWEKLQKELTRLRKKVNKAKVLSAIKTAIIDVESDLKRSPGSRKIRKTADEFLAELNEQ